MAYDVENDNSGAATRVGALVVCHPRKDIAYIKSVIVIAMFHVLFVGCRLPIAGKIPAAARKTPKYLAPTE